MAPYTLIASLKWPVVLLVCMQLAGCTAVSTVMALPSALFDSAIYMVRGEEASFSIGMKRTLAASQQGLQAISMPANLVLSNDEGYLIRFGESPFSGEMSLRRETATLSSIYIKVRKGIRRMDTIEQTLLEEVRKQARLLPQRASFNSSGYVRLFLEPDRKSEVVGWLRLAGQLDVEATKVPGWFKVSTSSGHSAYFRKR